MATYEEQIFPGFAEELTCSRQEYLASLPPLPGSEEARTMTTGSGRQCSMLLDESSPLGRFSKILLESLHWANSEEYCYVWNRLDTKSGLSAFQLTALGQSTDGNGSSLWPTATDKGNYNKAGLSEKSGNGLATAAKLWPTPIERDWKSTSHAAKDNARPLSEVAGLTGSGSLNPRFVCELMGFEAEHTNLKHWETLLFRNRLSRSSKRSQGR